MAIGLVGVDHTRAPLALRERLTVAGDRLDHLLDLLRADAAIDEAAVLSTCNRTELYVAAPDARAALARATTHLLATTGVPSTEVAAVLEPRVEGEAARHLCAVAAGLRSLVRGETQILAQVRESFAYATGREAAGPELQALARAAVRCGKRTRAETALGATDTSVSAVAVEMARRRFGSLRGRAAVLIGAGRINEVSAQLLRNEGVGSLVVVSRTHAAAARLAAACDGRAAAMEDLPSLLAEADLAITATRAPEPLIVPSTIMPRDRAGDGAGDVDELGAARPLLLFDIAAPRDVDPAVGRIAGVELVDIDAVRVATPDATELLDGVADAWAIVDESVELYIAEARARRAVPLIARLRAHVDRNKDAELARTLAGLERLSPADREAVALMAHRLVNNMFHHLATRLKKAAALPDGDAHLAALAFLFDEAGTEYRHVMAPPQETETETEEATGAGSSTDTVGLTPASHGATLAPSET